MEEPKIVIQLDGSGKTYAYSVINENGETIAVGDGYETPNEVLDDLIEFSDLLSKSLNNVEYVSEN